MIRELFVVLGGFLTLFMLSTALGGVLSYDDGSVEAKFDRHCIVTLTVVAVITGGLTYYAIG